MASTTQKIAATPDQLRRARQAAPRLALLSPQEKNTLLAAMAKQIRRNQDRILAANGADLAAELPPSVRDRLLLNPQRLAAMVEGIEAVIRLPDPVGEVVAEWTRPNGLTIRKVRVPLGVVGIIYEPRPSVTVDAAALALKAGNAVVLQGGREAAETNELLKTTAWLG